LADEYEHEFLVYGLPIQKYFENVKENYVHDKEMEKTQKMVAISGGLLTTAQLKEKRRLGEYNNTPASSSRTTKRFCPTTKI